MKYEVIKRLWTDDRVWAYGFAFWTQRKCFLILCVPAVFVELAMGMKYSYTCSEPFGKYLFLQKQIPRCGRQRHSRKGRARAQESADFCTSSLAHSSCLEKKQSSFGSAFASKCHRVYICLLSLHLHMQENPELSHKDTLYWTWQEYTKFLVFPISTGVNTFQLFYLEPCKSFLAMRPLNASEFQRPLMPSVSKRLLHGILLPKTLHQVTESTHSAKGEHQQGDDTPRAPT